MKSIKLLFTFILIGYFSLSTIAQTPNSAYTVQPNDWLRKIAAQAYDNPSLYDHIIEGTNHKAISDPSFKKITSANEVKIGQKIWIPALSSPKHLASLKTPSSNLANIPKTDCEIRLWYNFQVVAIGAINEKWAQDGIDLATRAYKAYEMRHEARVNARFMMQDKAAVKKLQARDMQKYGNPNGPTFTYLLKKNTDKGLTVEEAYQAVIESSSRTDRRYNADCQ